MFERFEPAARQAFVTAKNEAGYAGQDKVRSEHVLLGLLAEPGLAADALTAAGLDLADLRARIPRGSHVEPTGLDGDALARIGIDLDAVRRATDAAFAPGALDLVVPPGRNRRPIADDARDVLVRAVREAQRLGDQHISSGHMLIGILDQKRNGALTLLADAGVDMNALRADIGRRVAAASTS